VPELASEARTRLLLGKGGYRREHVRAFAQHAEIADDAIYIKVSKKHPIEDAGSHQRREVGWNRRSRFLPKWRTGWDSNIRRSNRLALGYAVSNVGFRDAASGSRTARKGRIAAIAFRSAKRGAIQ